MTVTQDQLRIVSAEGEPPPLRIVVEGVEFELITGGEQKFSLPRAGA